MATVWALFRDLKYPNRMRCVLEILTAQLETHQQQSRLTVVDLCLSLAFLSQRGRECIRMRPGDDRDILVRLQAVSTHMRGTADPTHSSQARCVRTAHMRPRSRRPAASRGAFRSLGRTREILKLQHDCE